MGEYVGVKRLDVFIFYASARYREKHEEKTYRIYLTDCARAMAGAQERWIDIITPRQTFDADKIAEDIIERAGLVIT